MMNERGLSIDHTTIYRWVQQYAPELEKRWSCIKSDDSLLKMLG
jgi:transposase-like protein